MSLVDQLTNQIPIETLIGQYVKLKRRGTGYIGLCPFHSESTPSLSVSPSKGIFKCFGCGVGGNVIHFVQKYEHVEFLEASKLLAERFNISISLYGKHIHYQSPKKHDFLYQVNRTVKDLYQKALSTNEPAIQYLRSRQISEKSILEFEIGYAPKQWDFLEKEYINHIVATEERKKIIKALSDLGLIHLSQKGNYYVNFYDRIIIPIYDVQNQNIGFGGRAIHLNEHGAKYINSTDSVIFQKKNNLYGLNKNVNAIRKAEQAILVEGYLDVIGLYQRNITNAIAVMGSIFTLEQAKLLKRYTNNCIIFLDLDEAGTKASYQSSMIATQTQLSTTIVVSQKHIQATDPFDFALKMNQIALLTVLDSALDMLDFILWYFFYYKFDLTDREQKNLGIQEFFTHVNENVSYKWEKKDYIQKASMRLGINAKDFIHDFNTFSSGKKPYRTLSPRTATSDNDNISLESSIRLERDILLILLKFPQYWEKCTLLDQIAWEVESAIYWLFSFFRDRYNLGQIWEWDNLHEAMSLLPSKLRDLLAQIIFESEDKQLDNTDNHIDRILKQLICTHKIACLKGERSQLQDAIKTGEIEQSDSLEELMHDMQNKLAEINQWENLDKEWTIDNK